MSGGHFEYLDSRLRGAIFGWLDEPTNVFEDREISELVWDVLELIHDYDWYICGDTCRDTYLKKKANFKKKWLPTDEVRVKRIVDEALQKTKQELYETFNVEVDDGDRN